MKLWVDRTWVWEVAMPSDDDDDVFVIVVVVVDLGPRDFPACALG